MLLSSNSVRLKLAEIEPETVPWSQTQSLGVKATHAHRETPDGAGLDEGGKPDVKEIDGSSHP
jgi:hypothetical protein